MVPVVLSHYKAIQALKQHVKTQPLGFCSPPRNQPNARISKDSSIQRQVALVTRRFVAQKTQTACDLALRATGRVLLIRAIVRALPMGSVSPTISGDKLLYGLVHHDRVIENYETSISSDVDGNGLKFAKSSHEEIFRR